MLPPLARPDLAIDALVGQPSFRGAKECGLLVDTEAPEDSLLLSKISPGVPTCGATMPPGGSPLEPDEIECVRSWIAQFAEQ